MIEIKEPKFKVGDRVYCNKFKFNAVVIGISDYSFVNDKYYYSIRYDDGDEDEMIEDMFDLYIEKPKTVWELQKGDTYYAINMFEGETYQTIFYDNGYDLGKRELGNCFLTKKEAEYELERIKIETEMIRLGGKRKTEQGKANWFFEYRPASGGIEILWSSYEMDQGVIYFDSEEKAEEAVEIIGKDRIKKYIFGVE